MCSASAVGSVEDRPTVGRPLLRGRFGTMASRFDPKSNIVGAQRLAFALLVIVSHSFPLGYGSPNPLSGWSRGQADLGTLGVFGFFVLSGFLIVSSSRRTSVPRFVWHRLLRIFPAFWVCLAATAFVLAPALYLVREKTLAGYSALQPSAIDYVTKNSWTTMQQYGIGDLLQNTPYGRLTGLSVFDGSLWSLRYELICYVLVLVLMVLGATRRRSGLLLLGFGLLVGAMGWEWLGQDRFGQGPVGLGLSGWPVFGVLNLALLVPLTAVFVLGGIAGSRPERFLVDGRLAALAAAVMVLTMRFGGFDVIGLLAFAYVVLWAATLRTPRLRQIGVRQDWSYGVYIYAFPIQQCLALVGVNRVGHLWYVVSAMVLSLLAGFTSWHLVEKRALALKDLTVWNPRRSTRPAP